MKRSMAAACALGFGLLASADGVQTASAMPKLPEGAAAAAQTSPVTQVWFRGGFRGGWRGGPGYWRPGYGWVPFAVAGAVVAGAAAAGAYHYYGPGPYYYGPYGPPPPPPPAYYGPGPDYGPVK